MTDDKIKEPGGDGSRSVEKKTLIIAGITVAVILIAIIAVVVIVQFPESKDIAQPATSQNFTRPDRGISLVPTQAVRETITESDTSLFRQTPIPQKTPSLPVSFLLQPGDMTSCGLTCRQLDASITNTGYQTAHDVCITVGLHNSRNEIINLNGEPSINRCIGDISGGDMKTETISINADCGTFASRCIGETLTLQTQVTSVEKTVRFPDQIISV